MGRSDRSANHLASLPHRYGFMLLIWSALVLGSLVWNMYEESQHTLGSATAAARANISNDLAFRRWATSHGGVYVPPTEHTPPNPYLKVPDRDVVTTTGKKLTLMNPAYMLRELQNDFPGEYGNKSHITSLKLLNPKNAPDDWEIGALHEFEQGEKERVELQQIDGQPYLRLMRPLVAEKGCLKCHGFQGYKAGDIRGGLSTSVAMAPYLAREKELNASQVLTHGVIWLIGVIGLGFSYLREKKLSGERSREEEELTRLSLRNKLILNAAGEGIYGLDIDGRCTFINPAAAQLLGYSTGELIGQPSHPMFHHTREDGSPYPLDECPVHAAYRQSQVTRGEDIYWRKDGSSFPVEFVSTPIEEADKITGAVVMFRDIAERKKAVEVLRQSEEKYRTLVHKIQAAVVVHGGDTKILISNSMAQVLLGLSEDQLLGKTAFDPGWHFFHEDGSIAALDEYPVNKVLASRSSLRNYIVGVHRPQHENDVWVLVNADPVFGEGGEIEQVIVSFIDITERKQAEEKLRRNEHSLSEAQRIAHLGNWDLDLVNNVLTWSDEIYRIFEIDKKKFGASYEAFLDGIHPEDREMVNNAYTTSVENRVPYDIVHRLLMKDGRIKYVNEKCETHYDAEGKPVRSVGTVHDITEQRLAGEALRKSEERLRLEVARMPIGYIIWDKDFRVVTWNPAAEKIFGFSFDEAKGKHAYEIIVPAEVKPIVDDIWRRLLEGDASAGSVNENQTKDGRAIVCEWSNTPLKQPDGTVLGVMSMVQDITERKRAEEEVALLNRDLERRVEERTAQLEAANKELEAFSYSVSHDLRAPLRAIDGFSNILLDEYADKFDDEGKHLLSVVRENSMRMGQLIGDILQFSRSARLELNFARTDMEALAREVLDELQSAAPNPALQVEIGRLPQVNGDRPMLRQVFVNLLSNAIKFSSNREVPRINVAGAVEGGEVVYSVKDNGAGFDMQYADKLFGVFQRLHSASEFEGIGIGLAIVKRIVTRHGGRVWAQGEVDKGATIYFALPTEPVADRRN